MNLISSQYNTVLNWPPTGKCWFSQPTWNEYVQSLDRRVRLIAQFSFEPLFGPLSGWMRNKWSGWRMEGEEVKAIFARKQIDFWLERLMDQERRMITERQRRNRSLSRPFPVSRPFSISYFRFHSIVPDKLSGWSGLLKKILKFAQENKESCGFLQLLFRKLPSLAPKVIGASSANYGRAKQRDLIWGKTDYGANSVRPRLRSHLRP